MAMTTPEEPQPENLVTRSEIRFQRNIRNLSIIASLNLIGEVAIKHQTVEGIAAGVLGVVYGGLAMYYESRRATLAERYNHEQSPQTFSELQQETT